MTQASSSFQVSQRFQNSKTESVERGDVCVTLRVPWRGLSFLYFCASEMTRWSTQPCTDGLEEQSNSLKQELQRSHLKHQDSGATFFFLFFFATSELKDSLPYNKSAAEQLKEQILQFRKVLGIVQPSCPAQKGIFTSMVTVLESHKDKSAAG